MKTPIVLIVCAVVVALGISGWAASSIQHISSALGSQAEQAPKGSFGSAEKKSELPAFVAYVPLEKAVTALQALATKSPTTQAPGAVVAVVK